MRHLMFQAPAHHTLNVDGDVIHGGQTFDVEDEERALELLTQPGLSVIEVEPGTAENPLIVAMSGLNETAKRGNEAMAALVTACASASLDNLSRSELDDLARERGIEEPERLPNKAAVIAALNQPEASTGEGQEALRKEP